MTSPTGTMRKLPYLLSFTEDMESPTGAETIKNIDLSAWSNPDPNVPVEIVMSLSLNEYIALASVIDVGRDIAYGDNSIFIWWLWVRSLESMAICQAIIDCIENDVNVRNAIQSANSGIPTINGSSEKWTQFGIEPVALCDKDTTWGYVKALWDFINQQNKDFLQWLSEASNTGEQISRMISAIPLFGLLPFDEIADWLGQLGEYNLDAYNSSITVVINEQIWCDLFCIAVENNCSITFEQVWDYMLEEFGGANFPTLGATFTELVLFMATGTYANDRIVYLWTLVQLGVAFVGGEWLGLNSMNEFAIHAQTGNPDNDWTLLCTECLWTQNFDFTADAYALYVTQKNPLYPAVWQNGVGYVLSKDAGGPRDGFNIILPTASQIEFAEVELTLVITATNTRWSGIVVYDSADVQIGGNANIPVSGGAKVYTVSTSLADTKRVELLGGARNINGSAVITSLKLQGNGVNPFV